MRRPLVVSSILAALSIAAALAFVHRPAEGAGLFSAGDFAGKMKEEFIPVTVDSPRTRTKYAMSISLSGDGTNVTAEISTQAAGSALAGSFPASGVASDGAFCLRTDTVTLFGTVTGTAPRRVIKGRALIGAIPPYVEAQYSSVSTWEFKLREIAAQIAD